jgi:hypothetical protein
VTVKARTTKFPPTPGYRNNRENTRDTLNTRSYTERVLHVFKGNTRITRQRDANHGHELVVISGVMSNSHVAQGS